MYMNGFVSSSRVAMIRLLKVLHNSSDNGDELRRGVGWENKFLLSGRGRVVEVMKGFSINLGFRDSTVVEFST